MGYDESQDEVERVAIVGLAGQFPGAKNIDEFWANLRDGVETIAVFTDAELRAHGIAEELLKSPNYVRARGALTDIELFDAPFFGVTAREASLMDPQFRFFLENSWAALENAGYDPETYEGVIGIYGGMSMGQYFLHNLLPNSAVVASAGALQLRILNDKDFLTTLAAYKLNLKGPSINVQTACSTSLVAVHLACQSLLSYQCDMALAGGVSVLVPQKSGYLPQEGVFSPDGHCRAFDAEAHGTVSGNGVGHVVLKRLSEALQDGDHIHAIIRGTAINNDGAQKVGYTAPSVDGQAEVIAMAQAVADVEPESITYIEAHGTGTPMGDPIEVAALTQVFRAATEKKNFCALGSVKTNIGHADAAAGVASLIKTVLALEHKALPPSLHFNRPNPEIDFANSPFFVNSQLTDWQPEGSPRRAGISAFAVGGTNAHIIVEEAPARAASAATRPWQLITLSGRTDTALEAASDNLVAHLRRHPHLSLADVAYTLHVGRRDFDCRRAVVCRDADDLIATLAARDPQRVLTGMQPPVAARPVAFMFPGLGNHYVNMGRQLYALEPVFREHVDRCCEVLKPHLGSDLRDVMYPGWQESPAPLPAANTPATGARLDLRRMVRGAAQEDDESTRRLNQTIYSQPAQFIIEYALAQLWLKWGIKPRALIGYSIGEYVAACLAGVYSLEDALMLVAHRARLIQELPAGAMLAVTLSNEALRPMLANRLDLAAINGPNVCVVAGQPDAIAALESELSRQGVVARRLPTTHAFHSRMMEAIVEPFTALVKRIALRAPQLPIVSNVTGTWLTAAQATDPSYWATHLCRPVLFGEGIATLWRDADTALLEVGPGRALGAWALQHPSSDKGAGRVTLPSLRHSYDNQHDQAFLLNTLGRLWLAGVGLDWREVHADEQRARVPLPGYPFERQRYWIDPLAKTALETSDTPPAMRKDVADWFDLPVWRQAKPQPRVGSKELTEGASRYLVFADDCDVSERLIAQLQAAGRAVTVVRPAAGFRKVDDWTFTLNPRSATDYESLVGELNAQGAMPEVVCHMWGVTKAPSEATDALALADAAQWRGFFSLLFLTQALGNRNRKEPMRIVVVSNGLHAITDDEDVAPAKATVLGPCLVIPQEYPHISCRSVDVALPSEGSWQAERLTGQLLAELAADSDYRHVAYRGTHRWTQTFEPARLDEPDGAQQKLLREGGIYLITGGLGGIGLTLAEHLAKTARARLVLVARTALPPRDEWATWLAAHDAQDESAKKIRKVQALETAGAEVLVVRADVTSRTDMEAMLAQTHEQFGKLDGIIHAAGVAPGGMIQVKSPETAANVLAPKVQGTLVLEAVCADDEPDFFLLCSSLNAFIGAFGLVDHCGANAFLDAFAESRALRSSRTRILSINWDAWLDVGQAATAELSAGLQEILREARRAEPTHPLLDQLISDSPEMFVYATELSSARHWVLGEHRFGANAVVPGTGYLEMVRAAFNDFAGAGPIVMRQVFFTAPLVVSGDEAREVRVIFTKDSDAFAFRIVSRAPEADWHEHVKGNVALFADESIITHPLPDILSRLEPQDMSAALNAERERLSAASSAGTTKAGKNFGPRWTELQRRIGIKGREAIACLELPTRFADDLHAYQLHPALLDAATGFVQLAGGGVYLPLAYESIEIKAALPGKIFSYASFSMDNPAQADVLVCDLIIMNEDGQELVKVKEYTLRRLTDPALLTGVGSERPAPATHLTDAEVAPLGAGRTQAVKSMSIGNEGIQPVEGALAFGRLISCGLNVPRIIVTPRDLLSALKLGRAGQGARLLEAVSTLQARRQKHARPNLSVAYVPPRSEMERKVARIWQDALGVEEAGIHDNFFDMGGDSLIATLLVGRLGEAFQVDLPLRALFEAPTVAEMTNAIVQKQASQVDEGVMQDLLAQIRNLSQNELQAQLNAEKKRQD